MRDKPKNDFGKLGLDPDSKEPEDINKSSQIVQYPTQNSDMTLFLDMDGVLVNYGSGHINYTKKMSSDYFFNKIHEATEDNQKFPDYVPPEYIPYNKGMEWHPRIRGKKQILPDKSSKISYTPTYFPVINYTFEYWADMDWEGGGKELYKAATDLFENVCILSSTGATDPESFKTRKKGKIEWCKRNIPNMPEENIFIVNGRHLKKHFANVYNILIDDTYSVIEEWKRAGGYGILHNAHRYKKTIRELEDILMPLGLSEIIKHIKLK